MENTLKGWLGQLLHKDIIHDVNQPSQQKPETKMGLYQQKYCPFEQKGIENR